MRRPSRRTLLAGVATMLVPLPALAQTATKEKVAAALPKLEEFTRQVIDRKLVPGLSIAIVHRDEVVLLGAFGVRQVGKPEPLDADTVFQLASLSKPLASTVVSALVSDGKVSWDSRIRDIDPGFALQDELAAAAVTVGDLFAHRSGLPGHVGDDIEELGFAQGEILHRLRLAKPAYSFRNGYSYSNFGLTEGAVAAARVAGMGWDDAAEEKLYKPLGMKSTSSRYRDFINRTNRAALHVPVDGSWASFTQRNADAQAPAGGASSTARDIAQWLRLLLANGQYEGREVIAKAALQQAHVPAIVRNIDPNTGAASFYGFGWNIDYREHGVEWSRCRRLQRRGAHARTPDPGRAARHRRPVERLPDGCARGHRRDLLRPGLRRSADAGLGGPGERGLRGGVQGDAEAQPRLRNAAGVAWCGVAGIRLCRRLRQRLCRQRQGHGVGRIAVPAARPGGQEIPAGTLQSRRVRVHPDGGSAKSANGGALPGRAGRQGERGHDRGSQ